MTDDDQTILAPLQRRRLLRGGAVLAGAAGVTAVGVVLNSPTAQAANGGNVVLGTSNVAAATTQITTTPASATPAVTLTNASGPALRLTPLADNVDPTLAVGDLVSTKLGPLVGVNYGAGAEVDYLATGADLDYVPIPMTVDPQRLLDTRSAAGRTNIIAPAAGALDSAGRLTAGSYIDVKVAGSGADFEIGGAFVNVVSLSSLQNGYLKLYPPGTEPEASILNFRTGVSVANGALVGLVIVGTDYAVRIKTNQTTHVVLDLSGVIISNGTSGLPAQGAQRRRADRQAKRAAQLRKSLRR